MPTLRKNAERGRSAHFHWLVVAAALWISTVAAAPPDNGDPAAALPPADRACIGCHGSGDATTTLDNGDRLPLAIDAAAFARSLHRPVGCTGCHREVNLAKHPGDSAGYASARAYAKARNEACRSCHFRIFGAYETSRHAQLHKDGNPAAPLCADCHPSHQVTPAAARNGSDNPCLGCHADAAERHASWLPNAATHVASVACGACHVPNAMRRVDLRILAGGKPLRDDTGLLQFVRRVRALDTDHNGLDADELRTLLAELDPAGGGLALRGAVLLRSGIDAHELPPKAEALRDCVACHDAAAPPFQYVTVSVLDADGRPQYYDARREILSSTLTWDALAGFYAVGGTRLRLFDIALGLALVGGISGPALHLILRRATARKPDDRGDPT